MTLRTWLSRIETLREKHLSKNTYTQRKERKLISLCGV